MAHPARDPSMAVAEVLAESRTRQPIVLVDCPPLPEVARMVMWQGVREGRPNAHVITFGAADLVAAAYAGWFDELSPYGSYVVWLDDLTPGDLMLLTPDVLDIITTYAAVAATICTRWCALFEKDTGAATADARYVMTELANRVSIPVADASGWDPHSSRLLSPVVGVAVADSAHSGERLLTRFRFGADQHPLGHELVQVAVDARRAGIHRGFHPNELRTLLIHSRTLQQRGRLTWAPPRNVFDAAWRWVTTPPPGVTYGLLTQRDRGWTAVNYLAGAQDGDGQQPPRPISHAQWSMMLDRLPPVDAFNIGVAAHLRGLPGIADAAYRVAVRCYDTVVAAAAERAY